MDFERELIKKWLLGSIGHEMDYKVRGYAKSYWEKGVITKEDAAEIDAKIEAQYIVETPAVEPEEEITA